MRGPDISMPSIIRRGRSTLRLLPLLSVVLWLPGCSQSAKESLRQPTAQKPDVAVGCAYDARAFLSKNDVALFNRKYPDFDQPHEVDWQYRDVDPIRLFDPAQDRARRRELFLAEYSATSLGLTGAKPSPTELAFRLLVSSQIASQSVLMDTTTAKIVLPYTAAYESLTADENQALLQKTASMGLQWALAGGDSMFIYNGAILISWFRHGYAGLANPNIDRPPAVAKSPLGTNGEAHAGAP